MPHQLVNNYHRHEGSYCLHPRDHAVQAEMLTHFTNWLTLKMETLKSFKMLRTTKIWIFSKNYIAIT